MLAALGSMKLLGKTVALCTPWFHDQGALLPYIVFVCLFVTILLVTTIAGRLFRTLIEPTVLGNLDKLLGSMLGIFKWSISISALLYMGNLAQLKIPETYTENTFLFPMVEALGPQIIAWCSPWIPYVQDWLTTTDTLQDH